MSDSHPRHLCTSYSSGESFKDSGRRKEESLPLQVHAQMTFQTTFGTADASRFSVDSVVAIRGSREGEGCVEKEERAGHGLPFSGDESRGRPRTLMRPNQRRQAAALCQKIMVRKGKKWLNKEEVGAWTSVQRERAGKGEVEGRMSRGFPYGALCTEAAPRNSKKLSVVF